MSGEISLLFIALGVIIILLDLWAIVSVFRSDKGCLLYTSRCV